MKRRRSAIGFIVIPILTLMAGVAVIQVALAPWLTWADAPPDFMLATTVVIALVFGPWLGALWGLGIGALTDVLSAHTLGLLALPLTVVGYIAGLGHHRVLESRILIPAGIGALATIGYVLLQGGLAALMGYPVVWSSLLGAKLWQKVIYTTLWTWLIFQVVIWFRSRQGS